MAEHLVLFTITPVQRFIETARKTEDLWVGSYILSFLNATAQQQLHGVEGIEMIYPDTLGQAPFAFWQREDMDIALPSFPNLFLAFSQQLSLEQLQDLMQKTEKAVQDAFERMAEHVLDEACENIEGPAWGETHAQVQLHNQVAHFWEIYWVVSPKNDAAYREWFATTGARLAAVKNSRLFTYVRERGRKCSLCGEREILDASTGDAMGWWRAFATHQPKYCRQGEALCVVCLTTRMGKTYFDSRYGDIRTLSFQSTSEVATADVKQHIAADADSDTWRLYLSYLQQVRTLLISCGYYFQPTVHPVPKLKRLGRDNNLDGEWLFEEAFSAHNLERYYGISRNMQVEKRDAIEACVKSQKRLVQQVGTTPSRYYSLIVLDGDSIGEVIGQARDRHQHTGISRELNKYTQIARQAVDSNHLGKLIYAGGDDVLALANLRDLVPILRALRTGFQELLPGVPSTASAGVCIAHCKAPLGEVLRLARYMEKEKAKKVQGKDALGLALLKHSGNASQSVFKWYYGGFDVLDTAEDLIQLIQQRDISKRFLYAFRSEFERLVARDGRLVVDDHELVVTELLRLITRATSDRQRLQLKTDGRLQTCVNNLAALLRHMGFTDFVNYLECVNFIARASSGTETDSEARFEEGEAHASVS